MIPDLSATQLTLIVVLLGTLLSLPLAAIVDALKFTPAQWQQIGHNRATWVTFMVVGIFMCGIVGAAVAVEYIRTVRPKLLIAPG